jgi:putative ABC transport system permease protein
VIKQQLAKREAPQLSVYMWTDKRERLRLEDMEFLKQRMVGWEAISTYTGFNKDQAIFQDRQADISIHAVSQDYLLTSGRAVLQGQFFKAADFNNHRPLAVIDEFLAKQLFPGQSPIGKRIYAANQPYTVVGVLETKLKSKDDKPSGEILVTLSFYRALTGSRRLGVLQIRPNKLEDMYNLEEQARQLLLQRFPDGTFWAENNVGDILEQRQTLEFVSRGLLVLGVITLLVGGVGIANITFASVIERTQEIGLRRAIGATQLEIRLQFILEAVILSLLGGTMAIATVHEVTSWVADRFKLPYEFELDTSALALGSALLVGVGGVFFPAVQASKLDPVRALRSQ